MADQPKGPQEMTAKEWADSFYEKAQSTTGNESFRRTLGQLMQEHKGGLTDRELWNEVVKKEPGFSKRFKITDLDAPPSSRTPGLVDATKSIAEKAIPSAKAAMDTAISDSGKGLFYRATTPIPEQIGGAGASLSGLVHRGTEQAHQSAEQVERMVPPSVRPLIGGIKNFNDFSGAVLESSAGFIDSFTSPVGLATLGLGPVAKLFPKLTPLLRWGFRGAAALGGARAVGEAGANVQEAIEHPSGASIGRAVGSTGQAAAAAGFPFLEPTLIPGRTPPSARGTEPAYKPQGLYEGMERPTPGKPYQIPGEIPVTQGSRALPAAPSQFRTSQEISNAAGISMEDVSSLGRLSLQELKSRRRLVNQSLEGEVPTIPDVPEEAPAGAGKGQTGTSPSEEYLPGETAQEHADRIREQRLSQHKGASSAAAAEEGSRPGESGPRQQKKSKRMIKLDKNRSVSEDAYIARRRNDLQGQIKAIDILIADKQRAAGGPAGGGSASGRAAIEPSAAIDETAYESWKKNFFSKTPQGLYKNRWGQEFTGERLREEYIRYKQGGAEALKGGAVGLGGPSKPPQEAISLEELQNQLEQAKRHRAHLEEMVRQNPGDADKARDLRLISEHMQILNNLIKNRATGATPRLQIAAREAQAPPATRGGLDVGAAIREAQQPRQAPPLQIGEQQLGRPYVEQQAQTRLTAPEANRIAAQYQLDPGAVAQASGMPIETINAAIDQLLDLRVRLRNAPPTGDPTLNVTEGLPVVEAHLRALQEIKRIRESRPITTGTGLRNQPRPAPPAAREAVQ